MQRIGFDIVDGFKFRLKSFRQGRGWSCAPKGMNIEPQKLPHSNYLKHHPDHLYDIKPEQTLPKKWLKNQTKKRVLRFIYCARHIPNFKMSLRNRIGHYISLLLRKA